MREVNEEKRKMNRRKREIILQAAIKGSKHFRLQKEQQSRGSSLFVPEEIDGCVTEISHRFLYGDLDIKFVSVSQKIQEMSFILQCCDPHLVLIGHLSET